MKHRKGYRISAAERALIKGCAERRVGIESLGNGSTFRLVPPTEPRPLDYGGPSNRPALAFKRKPHMAKIKTWRPAGIDGNPMYHVAMAGDPRDLTEARLDYGAGDPRPLRDYLAKQAASYEQFEFAQAA